MEPTTPTQPTTVKKPTLFQRLQKYFIYAAWFELWRSNEQWRDAAIKHETRVELLEQKIDNTKDNTINAQSKRIMDISTARWDNMQRYDSLDSVFNATIENGPN